LFWPGQILITVLSALLRRRLEIAARAHSQNLEDRRQTIIDMAPMGIYAKDTSGHYVVANEKADELAGLAPGELMGLTDDAFLTPEQAQLGPDSDRRVLEGGAIHEREDSVVIGGVPKTFKTIRFPPLDEDGEKTAVGGVSVDVTDQREAIRLRDELAATQQKAIEELRHSRLETIEGLAKAIELHDSPTADHVNRMGAISAFLGAQLGFEPDRVQLLRAVAPMHDVGKIEAPAALLRKTGPLNEDERAEMERHTVVGHAIFADFESDLSRLAATIALTHHERYDGSGYPQGLVAEEIPLEGRITAVADVFDALLSDRSYRPAMSVDEAVEIIKEGRGTHFDPQIVDALLEHIDEALRIRA
jgi:PAS domain S-box-containing protein